MNKIKINSETYINLNFETQLSKLNRPFRLSGVRKNLQIAPQWVGKIEKYHWIYLFIYLDEKEGFFEVEIDHHDNFVSLNKIP